MGYAHADKMKQNKTLKQKLEKSYCFSSVSFDSSEVEMIISVLLPLFALL